MGRLKRAVRNLSIKKTFMLYMLLFLLLATLLSSVAAHIADGVESGINWSYLGAAQQFTVLNGGTGSGSAISIKASPGVDYTPRDRMIVTACNLAEIWSIPLFFGLCIIASALLFYRNKLKKPIALLSRASEKIAGNDLDFTISYDSTDEMGRLCASFETMRTALLANNRELWRAIEERRRLNAAFSHDLRTPLTVLRGYADFLKDYVPEGKVGEQKLLSTVSTMSGQISRLESYVRTMSEVQKLEDIGVSPEPLPAAGFAGQIESSARVLAQRSGRKLNFENGMPEGEIFADPSVVLRVADNLLSNALRYAEDAVAVRCRYENETLSVTVEDDGPGFTGEDLKQAPKPYYRNQASAGGTHFGLGLFICKSLCEKHGGRLEIGNGEGDGARVTASFLCRKQS